MNRDVMRAIILISLCASAIASSARAAVDFSLPMCRDVAPETTANSDISRRRDETVSLPLVGAESQAEVGQSMVLRLNYTAYAGSLDLKAPIEFSGAPAGSNRNKKDTFIVRVPAGRYLLTPALNPYNPVSAYKVPGVYPLRSHDEAPYLNAFVGLRPGIDTVELVWVMQRGLWSAAPVKVPFTLNYCAVWSPGNFRRELVYSGVSKGTVSITYREFTDDLARPAFTQDLRYDLSEGDEIGFRGARFQVLKATNTAITYKVLKPLD